MLACFGVTCLMGLLVNKVASDEALYRMLNQLTKYDQVKQIGISVGMYLYGYLLCEEIFEGRNKYISVLAYPVAIMCWCVASFLLVTVGLPYTLLNTITILLIILVAAGVICKVKIQWQDAVSCTCIATGIAAVASSGLFLLMLTSDSLYYIMKYGEILVLDGGITTNASYWLTWTGIISAFMGSFVKFFGVYSLGAVHHCLMLSFLGTMGIEMYEMLDAYASNKKKGCITIGLLAFLSITPAFFLLNHWQMQNSYYMGYLILYMVLCCKIPKSQENEKKAMLSIVALTTVMLGMMRIESPVVICFLIICVSTLPLKKYEILGYMLAPLGIALVLYWSRVYIVLGSFDSDIFGAEMLFLIGAAWLIVAVYVAFLREFFEKFFGEKINVFILCVTVALCVGLAVLRLDNVGYNLKVIIKNFANALWGYFPWVVLFGILLVVLKEQKWNFYDLIWMGYLLFNLAVSLARNGNNRVGAGDSLNRIFYSIVPIIFLSGVLHWNTYRKQKE